MVVNITPVNEFDFGLSRRIRAKWNCGRNFVGVATIDEFVAS